MKKYLLVLSVLTFIAAGCSTTSEKKNYDSHFTGSRIDHIAYPIGGLGSGMFCLEGTGAISHMSVHHHPDLFNEPSMYAAIHINGIENWTKVVEAPVPDFKKWGRHDCGTGSTGATYGLPRFEKGEFTARFPFATISLEDDDLPLTASITGWNPFIPNDEDNSGLPVGGLEYTFTNISPETVEAVFSFNTKNFMECTDESSACITAMERGFVLTQPRSEKSPETEGYFAIFTPFENQTAVDNCWFRGGWWDPFTMAWNKVAAGDTSPVAPVEAHAPGASLYVPFTIAAGQSRTIKLMMAWYAPESGNTEGEDALTASDYNPRYDAGTYKDYPKTYRPWYATRFQSIAEVASYWADNYDSLKEKTRQFTDAFYDSTLPAEVIRAIADNLTILKSPTTMRQHDGRFWAYEGSGDSWGSCHGSCTHVWNYTQAMPHLFPRMERSLRETEFQVSQNADGHQMFRSNLPIRPVHHNFHAASDGQLGGIIKVYRDWRISGDTDWMRNLYPLVKASLDYCIRTWDPRETGALEEPHHNTYDIEFWGADGMCTSFYGAALESFVAIGSELGEDVSRYQALLEKSREYMSTRLWNGEYFYQDVRWKDLDAQDPTSVQSYMSSYAPEAIAVMEKEGPKYQYGTGCLSDGIIGGWMALAAGLEDPFDKEKTISHLNSIYRYNLKRDLSDHANPQRPSYALGHDGGLLLCTWPNGGKPSLPFVYSDEVWTGIEYQVAAHLMFEGEVEKGLDIVRTCLDRYDGRIRNPFNEYECGSWYARAMSGYSMLQALTGARYDAVSKTLYIDSKIGDFRSFLSTATGFGTVGLKNGQPFLEVKSGNIDVQKYVVSGKDVAAIENCSTVPSL